MTIAMGAQTLASKEKIMNTNPGVEKAVSKILHENFAVDTIIPTVLVSYEMLQGRIRTTIHSAIEEAKREERERYSLISNAKPTIESVIIKYLRSKTDYEWEGLIEDHVRTTFGSKGGTTSRVLRFMREDGLVEGIKVPVPGRRPCIKYRLIPKQLSLL